MVKIDIAIYLPAHFLIPDCISVYDLWIVHAFKGQVVLHENVSQTMVHPQSCCICNKVTAAACVRIGKARFAVLKNWTPNASTVNSRAHQSCLERIGLSQVPRRAREVASLEASASEKISDEAYQIIDALPRSGDVAEMCDRAWEAVKHTFGVDCPTVDITASMQRNP
jgi:hypothetical protein